MIVSPPFLPPLAAVHSVDESIGAAMPEPASRLPDTRAPEGGYPLGHGLAWHNGVHIAAPVGADGVALPVRAIADGRIVFVHAPAVANTSVDDPQNYNPFDRGGSRTAAWSDNGCVVVRHTTAIGAAGAAETEVAFFSLYMHLSALGRNAAGRPWQVDDAIWRKSEVGRAGQIYGSRGQIHFEVCLDAANLQRLIGRNWDAVAPFTGSVPIPTPTSDGRVDAIFGSIWFYLPPSTPTSAAQPTQHLQHDASGSTLGQALWVRMTYARGGCEMVSFDARGAPVGQPLSETDAEYELYDEAAARHASLSAVDRATSSVSGWYELLRFGRNVGRGVDARDLLPARAAHWRLIRGVGGAAVWVDLAAPGSFKSSDADFPPVAGWQCYGDDSSPNDQRCDSDTLKAAISDPAGGAERMQPASLTARLGDAQVRVALRNAICRFPCEWHRETAGKRYGFAEQLLQTFTEGTEASDRLRAHLRALTFDGLPNGLLDAEWHFHPRGFLSVLSRCGWLAADELTQLMPRSHGVQRTGRTNVPWTTAQARFARYRVELNRVMRKYGIDDAARQTHFLAQTYIETAMWQTMEEFGRARQQRRRDGTLYWPVATMEYYGAFFGRGIMQLTWAGNYMAYGNYRPFPDVDAQHAYVDDRIRHDSLHYWGDPRNAAGVVVGQPRVWSPRFDPSIVATDAYNACDSGAHYWVSKAIGSGLKNINRVCDRGVTPEAVGRASVLVNGGGFGYAERQAYAAYVFRFRGGSTDTAATSEFTATRGNRHHAIHVDFTPQRPD